MIILANMRAARRHGRPQDVQSVTFLAAAIVVILSIHNFAAKLFNNSSNLSGKLFDETWNVTGRRKKLAPDVALHKFVTYWTGVSNFCTFIHPPSSPVIRSANHRAEVVRFVVASDYLFICWALRCYDIIPNTDSRTSFLGKNKLLSTPPYLLDSQDKSTAWWSVLLARKHILALAQICRSRWWSISGFVNW